MSPKNQLAQEGIETHPGPNIAESEILQRYFAYPPDSQGIDTDLHPGHVMLEIRNCASIKKHIRSAKTRKAHGVFYQETSIDINQIESIKAILTEAGWASVFSPP